MTLSLSSSVRPFVRPLFFSLVSLKSVEHLECHKASKSAKGTQWESMCISRVFQGCIKGDSRKFQGSFKVVSRVFQGCFKGVHGCFKGV